MSEQEKIERLKQLVDDIADCDELDDGQAAQIVELCDVDWDAEELKMMCYEYWESPLSLDQIAYFLIHGEHQRQD